MNSLNCTNVSRVAHWQWSLVKDGEITNGNAIRIQEKKSGDLNVLVADVLNVLDVASFSLRRLLPPFAEKKIIIAWLMEKNSYQSLRDYWKKQLEYRSLLFHISSILLLFTLLLWHPLIIISHKELS